MSFGHLASYHFKIRNTKSEQVQYVYLLSPSRLLISFESYLEIWSTIPLGLIKRLEVKDSFFFWLEQKCIDESTICFINMQKSELCTFNLETFEQSFILKLPKDVNITETFVFKDSNNLAVVYKGLEVVAVIVNRITRESKTWNFKWESRVQKYDSSGTLVTFSPAKADKLLQFDLISHQIHEKVTIQAKSSEKIDTILKHSQTTCLVACYNLLEGGFIGYIYSLQKLQVVRQIRYPTFIDRILQTQYEIVGLALKRLSDSLCLLTAVQLQKENQQVVQLQIPNLSVQWDQHETLILMQRQSAENQVDTVDWVDITMVKWYAKQKLYIHLLQHADVVENFGVEIVKTVLNNLIQ